MMTMYLRTMTDRQTTILTLPDIDFGSLQEKNLQRLQRLFQHATHHVTGNTLLLDVSAIRSAGAAFLTQVHEFATVLGTRQVAFAIVGDVEGLIRVAGWDRQFRWYPSLLEALLTLPRRRQGLSLRTAIQSP